MDVLPSVIAVSKIWPHKVWINEISPTRLSLSPTPASEHLYPVYLLGYLHFCFLEIISLCRHFDLRAKAIRHFCRKE